MRFFSSKAEDAALEVAQQAWRAGMAALQEQLTALRAENAALQARLVEKDQHYAALVERLTAPAPVATKVVFPGAPEQAALTGAKQEYITRMAADFEVAGMSAADARKEAERLATAAEGLYR